MEAEEQNKKIQDVKKQTIHALLADKKTKQKL